MELLELEELFYLYQSEFANKYDDTKSVIYAEPKILSHDTRKEIKVVELMKTIVKSLNQDRQNHKIVMIFNSIFDDQKSKYVSEDNFEIE